HAVTVPLAAEGEDAVRGVDLLDHGGPEVGTAGGQAEGHGRHLLVVDPQRDGAAVVAPGAHFDPLHRPGVSTAGLGGRRPVFLGAEPGLPERHLGGHGAVQVAVVHGPQVGHLLAVPVQAHLGRGGVAAAVGVEPGAG